MDAVLKRIESITGGLHNMLNELAVLKYQVQEYVHRQSSPALPPSRLTQQFMSMPLEERMTSPPAKRQSSKPTPEFRRRIQPTHVGELPAGGIPLERRNAFRQDIWAAREQEWHANKAKAQQNAKSLDELAEKYKDVELSDTESEGGTGFAEGYEFKSKGNTRETVKQWLKRLNDALQNGVNPILAVQAYDDIWPRLKRAAPGFQTPPKKELIDSVVSILVTKSIFSRIMTHIMEGVAFAKERGTLFM